MTTQTNIPPGKTVSAPQRFWQVIGWIFIGLLAAFLINAALLLARIPYDWVGLTLYPVVGLSFGIFSMKRSTSLKADAALIDSWTAGFIRAVFWAILLIGTVETFVAFARVQGIMDEGLAAIRSPRAMALFVHLPLGIVGCFVALASRSLGFIWLGLMIVVAEMMIVVSRFVFSYEQPFMGDLVRYWYSGLLLLSAAYTLKTDCHVRVDVLYAGLSDRKRAWVDAIGSLMLGLSFCWIILWFGMGGRQSIILSPLANVEVSQSGAAGLFIKYHMAALLGVFAISLNLQFISTFFAALHRILVSEKD